jgi:hypothetical protein
MAIGSRLKRVRQSRSPRTSRRVPTSLTGQVAGGEFITKIQTMLQKAKTLINEKRPGVFVPMEKSSLVSPGPLALDHERVVPQKNYRSGMSIQYD